MLHPETPERTLKDRTLEQPQFSRNREEFAVIVKSLSRRTPSRIDWVTR